MRRYKRRQAGAKKIEITPAMIDAGTDALFDVLPEECVSWRTPGVGAAVCQVFVAMLEASAISYDIAQKERHPDSEY